MTFFMVLLTFDLILRWPEVGSGRRDKIPLFN